MKIVLLLALSSCTLFGEIGVHYAPYDDCDAISHRLSNLEKGLESRRAQARVLSEYACGAYSGVYDLTSGYTLHVFPDKKVMLSSWMDIGSTKLVGEGTWKTEENFIRIKWRSWKLDAQTHKFFVDYHGECKDLFLYLCFDDQKVVRQVFLVSRDKDADTIEFSLFQRSRYVDWKSTQDALAKKQD